MKINTSLRVYEAYSRHLLYTLYLLPCCTPDLQRTPTWKETANEIMERATLDRCHHFHGHSGMCAQLASWFELFCFSSLPGRVLISVPRGLCQKYFRTSLTRLLATCQNMPFIFYSNKSCRINYQKEVQASSTSAISTPTYPPLWVSKFQTSTICLRLDLHLAMEIHVSNILGDVSVGKNLLLRATPSHQWNMVPS